MGTAFRRTACLSAAAVGVFVVALPNGALALDLNLSCAGEGPTWSGSGAYEQKQSALARADFEFQGTTGRVRLPVALLPTIHMGSQDGWWKLRGIESDEHHIKAHFSMNPIDSMSVVIDRRSGTVDMRSLRGYGFSGICEVGPSPDAPPKF